LRPACEPRRNRVLYVSQADGADVTLDLRQDVGGLQALQDIVENFINRNRRRQGLFHQMVDFAAVAGDRKSWPGANRQGLHGFRVIAFVGSSHQIADFPERVNNLGGAGNQGDDPGHG